METIVWIIAIGAAIWVVTVLVRRGRETDMLEGAAENLDLREANEKYYYAREFAVHQMMDPSGSGITADQARFHIEQCVSFLNRIRKLEGGNSGPEYRVSIRNKVLREIKEEADRRREESFQTAPVSLPKNNDKSQDDNSANGGSGIGLIIENIYLRLTEVEPLGSKSAEEIFSEQSIRDFLEMTTHVETVVAMIGVARQNQLADDFLEKIDYPELIEGYEKSAKERNTTFEDVFAEEVDGQVESAKSYGKLLAQKFENGEIEGSVIVRDFCAEQMTRVLASWMQFRIVAREKANIEVKNESIASVRDHSARMGFEITAHGAKVAADSLSNRYNSVEVASYIAVVTTALDVKEAGDDIDTLMTIFTRTRSHVLVVLKDYAESDQMRKELWENDVRSLERTTNIDESQEEWVEKVLTDPVPAKVRLAVFVG
jgi:hypothetical protein